MSGTSRRPRSTRRQPTGAARWLGPIPNGVAAVAALAVVAVVALAIANTLSGTGDVGGSRPSGRPSDAPLVRYDVGQPGVGAHAPDFALATDGGMFRLSEQLGKNVLLYFHEGLGCAPCWQQIDDMQADVAKFRALGIAEIVPISVDPADAQRQRAGLRGITFPVLADDDLAVSRLYDAQSYGMMGGTRPGHTFILVGPDGTIRWRADYGGPPDYTMYVPDTTILSELERAMTQTGSVQP